MTEAQLRGWLEVWKTRLGLENWKIWMEIGGCEDEATYMEVDHSVAYDRARIYVQPWLVDESLDVPTDSMSKRKDLTDEFIEECLVHELLHIAVTHLKAVVRNDLETLLQRDVHAQVVNNFQRMEEHMVDRLAVALVKAFTHQ